jgi:hypothetical protein
MKKCFVQLIVLIALAAAGPAFAETIRLQFDGSSPQVSYAAERLGSVLTAQRHAIAQPGRPADFSVVLSLDSHALKPEAFTATWRRSRPRSRLDAMRRAFDVSTRGDARVSRATNRSALSA